MSMGVCLLYVPRCSTAVVLGLHSLWSPTRSPQATASGALHETLQQTSISLMAHRNIGSCLNQAVHI